MRYTNVYVGYGHGDSKVLYDLRKPEVEFRGDVLLVRRTVYTYREISEGIYEISTSKHSSQDDFVIAETNEFFNIGILANVIHDRDKSENLQKLYRRLMNWVVTHDVLKSLE